MTVSETPKIWGFRILGRPKVGGVNNWRVQNLAVSDVRKDSLTISRAIDPTLILNINPSINVV